MEINAMLAMLTAALAKNAAAALVSFLVTNAVKLKAYLSDPKRTVVLNLVNAAVAVLLGTLIVWQTGDVQPLTDAVGQAVAKAIEWVVSVPVIYLIAWVSHKFSKTAYGK